MKTHTWTDSAGIEWLEYISKLRNRLQDLKDVFESRGHKAYFSLFDCANGEWMLTVKKEKL